MKKVEITSVSEIAKTFRGNHTTLRMRKCITKLALKNNFENSIYIYTLIYRMKLISLNISILKSIDCY